MRIPDRALCRIAMCTTLLIVGTGASNDLQNTFIDHIYEEPMPSVQHRDMNFLSDDLLENSVSSVPKAQLVFTCTEDTEYYACSSSSSTILHKHDITRPMEYTELIPCTKQTDQLPSSYSTVCESGTEYPPVYCIPNESVQKHTESESLDNYKQSSPNKRHKKVIEENIPRQKQKKTNESSLDSDRTDNKKLNSSKINQIKKNISIWNNARLKNKHRKGLHVNYKPAIVFNKFKSDKYKEIDNRMHQSLIETHVKRCKTIYREIPVQNEFWFAIASRTSRMHKKLADCQVINENLSDYKFIEGLSGYYPGLPGDIVRYMDKHGPIVSDQKSIKTEWNETLGDIYVRKSAEPEYEIGKESIIVEGSKEYRLVATVVRMILGLPEVHKDLSNLTTEFIEKTLKEETDSNHLKVVRALHKIVEKHKSSSQPEIDKEYAVLCNIFTNILQQIDALHESIVIRLYTEMYKSLTYFYKKAKACEEILDIKKKRRKNGRDKEYYLLAGKCIIKQQKYLKCTTVAYLNKPVDEYRHRMDNKETNKWSIPSEMQKHYHIHYVDNTKQQYTRVCMPMYLNQHIHTISQIIQYLKILYNIEKEECIFPYKRNNFDYWEYIQEEEREKTVQEFIEFDIAFYYIEEGIRENYFTFAEFESCIQPEGRVVRIPLFLSPLMRSSISVGPFEERDKIKHTIIDSMQSMWIWPSVYTYKEEYKAIEYSHVHHYYSNLYIRIDNADVPTIDCYIMDSKVITGNSTATIEWYTKVPNSVNEYTHCIVSDELINDQDKYDKFSKAVKTWEYTPDSTLYGFGLQNSLEKTDGLDSVGCSSDDSIDPNSIADCKLSIVLIHRTSTNPKIANIQSTIDELDREAEQINMEIKESGTTEELKKELKRQRHCIESMKYYRKQKLRNIQPKEQLLINKESDVTPLPLCSFLVFRRSNTRTKSILGAHNEILDALSCKYY